MKKIYQSFIILLAVGLLLGAYPLFHVVLSAPTQAIDTLSLTKTDGVSQVTAGDGVTYTYVITMANPGFARAKGVVVRDTWPEGFTRGSITPSKGSCSTTSTGFSCNIGTINVGAHETISVDYTVPAATLSGTYTNTVLATATEGSLPVTAFDANSVITEADVRLLSKTDSPDPVNSGNILTYNLSVTNFGPSNASNVVLTDNLPAGTQYQDGLSTPGCSGPLAGPVNCPLGVMTPGANRQVEIKVLVTSTTAGTINNVANVTAATTDPDLSNNEKQQSTTVRVDLVPPDVSWTQPVATLGYYDVFCRPDCPTIHLEASASDNVAVERVYFKRWNHIAMSWVEIGNDFTSPYTRELDTSTLPFGTNQIYAQAYDTSGNPSAGAGVRIFLYKPSVIFMPIIRRSPQ